LEFDTFASRDASVPVIPNRSAGEDGHHQSDKAVCGEESYESPSCNSIPPVLEEAQELTADGAFGKRKT
jgi:hypothetical protein